MYGYKVTMGYDSHAHVSGLILVWHDLPDVLTRSEAPDCPYSPLQGTDYPSQV